MAAAGLSTQAVAGSLASAGNHGPKLTLIEGRSGLRAPSDRMALKSAFNNGGNGFSAAVVMPETAAGAVPPRISMRAAAKTSYICKDCGYVMPFPSISVNSVYSETFLNVTLFYEEFLLMLSLDFYNRS